MRSTTAAWLPVSGMRCAPTRRCGSTGQGARSRCNPAALRWRKSVRVARRDVARDFGALFQIAADREIGRGRAGAIALLEAAVAAVEACGEAFLALAARRLGGGQSLP